MTMTDPLWQWAPRYLQIAADLREQIVAGVHTQRLPSELELMQSYAAAQVTVQQALRVLREIGLLHVLRGRGWFVVNGDDLALLRRARAAADACADTVTYTQADLDQLRSTPDGEQVRTVMYQVVGLNDRLVDQLVIHIPVQEDTGPPGRREGYSWWLPGLVVKPPWQVRRRETGDTDWQTVDSQGWPVP